MGYFDKLITKELQPLKLMQREIDYEIGIQYKIK